MKKAEAALKEEQARVDNYLRPESQEKLLRAVEVELLKIHEMTLLNKVRVEGRRREERGERGEERKGIEWRRK